tara:strand:+ start:6941 stop:8014 length:1074 start_codon:yes stop_codon:yes gene_type:complete
MASENFALILAGGSGTRFWPLSRHRRPKQLLQLFDEETLIEKTISRLDGLIPVENILILTNHEQLDEMRAAASMLPPENILAEPAKRDTAPAVALGIGWVANRNPDATMAVLPADHLIQDHAEFHRTLGGALEVATKSDHIVTIGIKPTWACPGYGYIERGSQANLADLETDVPVYEVDRFREKPSPDLAEEFLRQGNFSWNAGMFIWSLKTVTGNLKEHCPELAGFIDELAESSDMMATIEDKFGTLPKISIDYALMEKADKVYNLEATFDWDDVGGWPSVANYLEGDESENRVKGALSEIDSRQNIVYSTTKQHIALLDVDELIVVQTEDALLIANRDRADDIKKLIEKIPKELQ